MVHNRFEVTQNLGRGAEAPVVLARDRALAGRLVALKDLSEATADDVARAQREYRLFAELSHPHLARLLDYGAAGSAGAYLTYEYVPGRSLEEARDLAVDAVTDCAAQALRALAFLHAKGILHGDVSPTNLRITPSGQLKLIDFGLARPLGSVQPGGGTPPYLAPERRQEGPVAAAADLFSLGAVLYRALAGVPPFPIAQGGCIEYERVRPLSGLRPDLAPELADWLHGLLHLEPAGRPPSARHALAGLAAALGREIPLETPETKRAYLDSATLVGHGPEREQLRRILAGLESSASRETPAIALVQGEQGLGKSRLLRDLDRSARLRGIRVLESAAQGGAALPFSSLRELLERLEILDGPVDVERLAAVREAIEELGCRPSAGIGRTTAAIGRVYDLAASALFETADNRPLLVLVDDLHRTDAATLDFLSYVTRNLEMCRSETPSAAPRLALVMALEPGETRDPSLERLVKEAADARGEAISLRTLDPGLTARLVSELLGGGRPEPEQVEWAYRVSRGNPLFLRELFASLGHRLTASPEEPGLTLELEPADREAVPATYAELVRTRLGSLAPEQRERLGALSVFQVPIRLEVAAAALGLAPDEAERCLRELVSAGFLRTRRDRPGLFAFRDDSMRQVVAGVLDDGKRVTCHRRAGEALQAHPARPPEEDWPELAHHFLVADPQGQGWRLGEHAAAWLESRHAYPGAIALRERSVAANPPSAADRVRLRAALAEAYLATGQGKAAIDVLEPALALAGDDRARLRAELGRAHAAVGEYRQAIECFRRSLHHSRGRPWPERIGVLLRRAESAAALGRYTASVRLGRFSLRAGADTGPEMRPVRVELHRSLSHLAFQRGEFVESRQHAERWLPLVEGLPLEEAAALNQLGNVHLRVGQPEKARELYERALALREKCGDLQGMAATLNNLGILGRRTGNQGDAAECFRRAVKIQGKLGDRTGQATTLNNLANLYYDDAKVDRAIETYRRCLALSRQIGNRQAVAMIHANLGAIAATRGEYGQALDSYVAALRLRRELRAPGRMDETLINIGGILVDVGDLGRARRILTRVHRRTCDTSPILAAEAGFELGRIAELERRRGAARRTFEETATAARSLALRALEAEAHLALADHHLALGDLGRGRAALDRAAEPLGETPQQDAVRIRFDLARIELDLATHETDPAVLARDLERILGDVATRGNHPLGLDAMHQLARIRQRLGDPAGALDLYQQATDRIERIAAGIPSGRVAAAFLSSARVRRIETAVSSLRHQLYLRSTDPTVRTRSQLVHLKSDLYDVERNLDFTQSRFDKQNAGLKRILEIAHRMSAALRTDGLFELILDSIMELADAERGFVLIRDPDRPERLRVTAARDRNRADIARPEREISFSVVSRVLTERAPIVIRDAAGDDIIDHTQSILRLDLRSILCVPLVSGQDTTGVLYVENRSRADRFAEDDLELLEIFAHQAAVALTNAGLFRELERSLVELKEAQDRLIRQEKLRLLGEMASGVLHNIKNLLTPVLGHSQILLMDPANGHLAEELRAIERLTLDCRDVIQRFSNFSRGGDTRLKLAPLAVQPFVDEVASITRTRWQAAAHERGATIRLVNQVPADLEVAANAAQLREVFVNLIYNAADAMPDGGEIRISAAADEHSATITVADTGIGMTDEVKSKMFEPFFSTKKQKGMGVGMSVTELIVQQHGGRIEVDSAPGAGTRISLIFPRRPAESAPAAEPAAAAAALGTVVVVDDDPDVRRFVGEALRAGGYAVHAASSAAGALEALDRIDPPPDLLLTDLRMPGHSGLELAAEAKRRRPGLAAAVMTAWPREVPEDDPNVDAVLAKPVTLSDLTSAVERLVRGGLAASTSSGPEADRA